MNQREVWDNIAENWNLKRKIRVTETVKFLENKKGLVLDLGCGSGRNFIPIDGKIIGVDFSQRMIKLASNRAKKDKLDVDLAVSDALELPFKDDSFDSVVMSSVLHCIKWNKRKKALSEMKRIAKDGAHIFISVWNKDQPKFAGHRKETLVGWNVKEKQYERYYYLYSKDELEALMKKYFKNVRVFGGQDKAFKKFPKNIIAIARVAK